MKQFVMVLLMSFVVGCGSVVAGGPVDGTGGMAGEMQTAGTTGSAGSDNSAGGSSSNGIDAGMPDTNPPVCTQDQYDQSVVGDWLGTGISNYTQLLFVINVIGSSHRFNAWHVADMGGGTQSVGNWELVVGDVNTLVLWPSPDMFKVQVIVNTITCKVYIPGYVKQSQ